VLDKVKAATFLATDRVHVLREAITCCRKAGTVSVSGPKGTAAPISGLLLDSRGDHSKNPYARTSRINLVHDLAATKARIVS
jgi:hypothetical protein